MWKWLRQKMAFFLAFHTPEGGGMMHNYKNGQWELLHVWSTEEGAEMAITLAENMLDRAADEIYVATVKNWGAEKRGYFVVHESQNRTYWLRGFWTGIYEPEEAFDDLRKKCRALADKMGYRRPE